MRWGTLWTDIGRFYCLVLLTSGLAASSSADRNDLEEVAVQPPPGFIRFCLEFADQCETPANSPSFVLLTKEKRDLVRKINLEVNEAIWPEDDLKHYGRAEYWTIPTDGYGDCEDFALTKRKLLMASGLPPRALRIAIVISPIWGRHALLTLSTDCGDLVLDNLTDDLKKAEDTPYRWVERQSAANLMVWEELRSPPEEQPIQAVAATK